MTFATSEGIKKIIRINPEYIKLCDLLEYIAKRRGIDRNEFYNDLFCYSINYLRANGFNFDIDVFKPKRQPKGFTLSKDVADMFDLTLVDFKRYMKYKYDRIFFVADFAELLLYIYSNNNIKSDDLKSINMKWGITEVI